MLEKNGRNVPLEKVTLSKQGWKPHTRPYSVISVSCLLSLQVRISFMLLSALQGQWSLFVFFLKDAPSPTNRWHERDWNCFIICGDKDENDNFLFPMCNCSSISKKTLVFSSKWKKIKWIWKKLMQISVSVDLPSSSRMWVYTCAMCIMCMLAGFRCRHKSLKVAEKSTIIWLLLFKHWINVHENMGRISPLSSQLYF